MRWANDLRLRRRECGVPAPTIGWSGRLKSNLNVRKLLIGIVAIIVLAFIFMRGDQLVELADTVRQGSALPLVVAIGTQLGKYALQGVAYQYAFRSVGERYQFRHTLPLVFGTFFMNTIAPSANLAGITLVVDDARRRGIEGGKAMSAALFMQITIDSGFAVIIVVGFSALALTVGLPIGWFVFGLIDIAAVAAMSSVIVLGGRRPDLLKRFFRWVERTFDKLRARFKRGPLNPWADSLTESFSSASRLLVANPGQVTRTFLCSVGASCCELLCFVMVGIAFGVSNPEALVCGYVVATLFAMFSFTPQGVGFVEAAVLVAMTMFGESSAAGMALGIVYRGIVFWIPFLTGAVLIQTTSTFKGEGRKKNQSAQEAVAAAEEALIAKGSEAESSAVQKPAAPASNASDAAARVER